MSRTQMLPRLVVVVDVVDVVVVDVVVVVVAISSQYYTGVCQELK